MRTEVHTSSKLAEDVIMCMYFSQYELFLGLDPARFLEHISICTMCDGLKLENLMSSDLGRPEV